jgi:hypothetical protein
MRTVAAVCLTLVLAACTPQGAARPATPAPPVTREAQAAAPATTLADKHCRPPRTFLEVDGRSVLVPSYGTARRRLTVRVGDVIRLRATGNCAWTVSASPQNPRLRVVWPADPTAGPTRFRAVRPGVVRLAITMPMCALPHGSTAPRCAGGIRGLGTVRVSVRPAAG